MAVVDYSYEEQGRRPGTLLGLLLSVAMLAVGTIYAAPWYALLPVLIAVLMLMWMVFVNRKSGTQLSGDTLSLYAGTWSRVVPIAQIKSVRVVEWSDSAPSIALMLTNNEKLDVPGYCFGSGADLVHALRSRHIPIT